MSELKRMWRQYCEVNAIKNYNAAIRLRKAGKDYLADLAVWKGDLWRILQGMRAERLREKDDQ